MNLTLIQPCMGRRLGQPYLRTWQMEPLAPAILAALTPSDVRVRFYDDRLERIPYDEPTDLAAITIETYAARRAYQIASRFRERGVPVVMGGFHAILQTREVLEYADAVVVGEAEGLWPEVVEDARRGRLKRIYRQTGRPSLAGVRPDRRIFQGKNYLPVGLVEYARGCRYRCEFCAIQSNYKGTQTHRPIDEVLEEIRSNPRHNLWFIVDDDIASDLDQAKAFFRALTPLKIRWISQCSIHITHDEEALRLMAGSGCRGVLMGFESLKSEALRRMNKHFNAMHGGPEAAMAKMRAHRIPVYATFIFGHDDDRPDTWREIVDFASRQRFITAAFNHLLPFPGTPLYDRFQRERRLLRERWWMDPDYRFGMVPFQPAHMTPEEVTERTRWARRRFFSIRSILRRGLDFKVNAPSPPLWLKFMAVNFSMRYDVAIRHGYPLGDEADTGPLIKVAEAVPLACAS